jgi:hypothetical protein
VKTTPEFAFDRVVLAARLVRERLLRATGVLEVGGVEYAITGECASAAWISSVDPTAVRVAARVEVLLRRTDLDAAAHALAPAGFIRGRAKDADAFLDQPYDRPRDSVRVVFSDERSGPDDFMPAPTVEEFARPDPSFRALALEPHARLGLTRFRLNDRVDLRDMLNVGLLDETWVRRYPPELGSRLQHLIDTPEG